MKPVNPHNGPMLTDLYQLSMAYAYWKAGRHMEPACFDLFFRKCPFGGEFAVFAGLEEVLNILENFRFTDRDIAYLRHGVTKALGDRLREFETGLREGWVRQVGDQYEMCQLMPDGSEKWEQTECPANSTAVQAPLPFCEHEFYDWLLSVDCNQVKVYAVPEGTFVFPRVPMLRIEAPLAIGQLLETVLLNAINFSTLVATNAARHRLAVGPQKSLLEFGLRRSQGPDGGITASRNAYLGGFDGSSNVKAGQIHSLPISGTHAHAFVQTYTNLKELNSRSLVKSDGEILEDFVGLVLATREKVVRVLNENGYGIKNTNEGELAAFIAYAQAFPSKFLALVDTYDVLRSGVPNFLSVAVVLYDCGYWPIGIRLDSGLLDYLSLESRKMFQIVEEYFDNAAAQFSKNLLIVASNDINVDFLLELERQGNEINSFGVGTHMATCQSQPALGGVYKLVEISGKPRIKISQDKSKITIPGRKEAYRLYGKEGFALFDAMLIAGEEAPQVGEEFICRHPFDSDVMASMTPQKVQKLLHLVWGGKRLFAPADIHETRKHVLGQLENFRQDHLHLRRPTPYKVSVSERLFQEIAALRKQEAPSCIVE